MAVQPLRDRRILAVEDEYYLAMDLERELTGVGAAVIGPAPSVEQALTLIDAEPAIDAAVLDINLGGELAYPVADALRARGIPFLFATGYSDRDLCIRYPNVPRCEKPFEFRHLEQALAKVLRA